MDNITHTLAGALLGQMGLKRRSRFAFAACLLGANAPDIDVFAPLVLPVESISFHRGPVHGIFAWPILAAGIVAMLWLLDRLKRPKPDSLPFRPGAIFIISLLAVLTHPFLDWLTTYAIALFAPVSWRWYSGDAIFIVDWVYWLLMIAGIAWSAIRWRRKAQYPGRPAKIAGLIMLAYIGLNLAESAWAERATAVALNERGLQPTLVVASPPPLAFWERTMLWRSTDRLGSGEFDPVRGLQLDPINQPLNLEDPHLATAKRRDSHVRAFLIWSRMPIVVEQDSHAFLTDQRFYGQVTPSLVRSQWRRILGKHSFLIPLDSAPQAK